MSLTANIARLPAYIPSPSQGVWHIGPIPIRGYALCIIAGVIVAAYVGDRRWVARGGEKGRIADVATWGVPFGLVGARVYHLATNPEIYWGKNGSGTIAAFKIWDGGLGIWGGILFGAWGAWIACRRYGLNFAVVADSLAPAIPLYGRPSGLPWALKIDPAHREARYADVATYQPTFLYESLWDIGVALVVIAIDRKVKFTRGRAFALYAMLYTIGRGWIEALRIDDAHRFFGLRLNDWTSLIVFLGALAYFIVKRPRDSESHVTPDDDAPPAVEAPESPTLTA